MKKIILFILLFAFIACKDEKKLGATYYYLPDYESIDVGYPYGSIIYKSNQEYKFEKVLIFSDILKVNSNEKYVIVMQKPNKDVLVKHIKEDLEFWNKYYLENKKDSTISLEYKRMNLKSINDLFLKKEEKRNMNEIADSIFSNEDLYKKIFKRKINYYIIDKEKDSLFGPLDAENFKGKKDELGIDLNFDY